MSEKSASAALRVFTQEPNTAFISHCLGVNATEQHHKGDLMSKKNTQSGVFKESLWLYKSPLPESRPLSEHIEVILTILESPDADLKSHRCKVTSIDVFCKFTSESGQGSMELNALLLQRLAKQQIDLIVDLYPPT